MGDEYFSDLQPTFAGRIVQSSATSIIFQINISSYKTWRTKTIEIID